MKEALVIQIDNESIYLMTDEMKMQKIIKRENVVVGERIAYQWYEQLPLHHFIKGIGIGLVVLFFSVVLFSERMHPVKEPDRTNEKDIIVEALDRGEPSIYYVESPFEQGEIMKERQLISSELKTRDVIDAPQKDEEGKETTSDIKINLVDEEKP